MNKITRKYETEDTISIWTYDLDKFKNGPISVEIIDKKPEPTTKRRKTKKTKEKRDAREKRRKIEETRD